MKLNFNYIIIGVLVLVIILMRMCTPPVEIEKPVVTKTTEIMKVPQFIPYDKYIPGPKEYIKADTVYKDVDTTAILKDYFSKIIYDDTIRIDTNGYIRLKETISENRIVQRETWGKYDQVVVTNTITTQLPPLKTNQVYLGLSMMGVKTQPINYFGADLYLKTKKDKLYTIGAGLGSNSQVNYKIGLAWKIKLRK